MRIETAPDNDADPLVRLRVVPAWEEQFSGMSPRYGFNLPHERFFNAGGLGATKYADFPTLFKARRTGILEAPTLTAVGCVSTSDVFAQPSVALKQLTLTTTVENHTPAPVVVEVRHAVRLLERDGLPGRAALA